MSTLRKRFCKHCNGLMRLGVIRPDNRAKWIHAVRGAGERCRKMREVRKREVPK